MLTFSILKVFLRPFLLSSFFNFSSYFVFTFVEAFYENKEKSFFLEVMNNVVLHEPSQYYIMDIIIRYKLRNLTKHLEIMNV